MLYTQVDAQCDKLATDDRRQFITRSPKLTTPATVNTQLRNFSGPTVWDKGPEGSTFIVGNRAWQGTIAAVTAVITMVIGRKFGENAVLMC